jgi:methyltransferase (TIGR00027 family)
MSYHKRIRLLTRLAAPVVSRHPVVVSSRSIIGKASKLDAVPATSQMAAAMRAAETELPAADRRINDPFARLLADEPGFHLMRGLDSAMALDAEAWNGNLGKDAHTPAQRNFFSARAAFFDGAIRNALEEVPAVKQIVTLGSGMDTRAFRLGIPKSITMYEIDYPQTHAYKTQKLELAGAEPTCERIAITADMATEDWAKKLLDAGFDRSSPTVWVAEGVLYYIPKNGLLELIKRVDDLSLSQSHFVFDSYDNYQALLEAVPTVKDWLFENGVVWHTTTVDATQPLAVRGWEEVTSQFGLFTEEYVWKKS